MNSNIQEERVLSLLRHACWHSISATVEGEDRRAEWNAQEQLHLLSMALRICASGHGNSDVLLDSLVDHVLHKCDLQQLHLLLCINAFPHATQNEHVFSVCTLHAAISYYTTRAISERENMQERHLRRQAVVRQEVNFRQRSFDRRMVANIWDDDPYYLIWLRHRQEQWKALRQPVRKWYHRLGKVMFA